MDDEHDSTQLNHAPASAAFRKDRNCRVNIPESFLDSFQSESGISLESLQKAVFPFASRRALNYVLSTASPEGSPVS
jgi:hypothetical protein